MSKMISESRVRARALAFARTAGFALAGCLTAASWAGTPAQVPLVSRVVNPPTPNVMITIDDSGSMQAHFMPEGAVTLNNGAYRVQMPVLSSIEDMIDVFYGDQINRIYPTSGPGSLTIPKGISYAVKGNSSSAFQQQMRSSDINSIFYDPSVLYLPWLKSDGLSRMPAGVYTAAYWNVADATIKNPTTDLSKTPTLTASFCGTPTNCKGDTVVYNPGLFYVLKNDGKSPPTYSDPNSPSSYVEYDLNDGTKGSKYHFPASAARVCTAGGGCCDKLGANGCTVDQERQNFANWFVYYRSRTHLVKGSLSETLPSVVNQIRVAWGTINTRSQDIDGATTDVLRTGVRQLDATQLDTVMSGLQGINPYGSTPLRQATQIVGTYFGRTGSSSPWNATPGTSDASPATCRRSYHLLTTDGYYNDNMTTGNVDDTKGPDYGGGQNPLGAKITRYIPGHPYQDDQSDTLADFAMKFYDTDLQSGIDNRVQPNDIAGDIAYWQHLSMFTVGLGVQGKLNWNIDLSKSDLPALTAGTKTWGTDKIDDLWHAAVNSHGTYFSAKNSTTLASALKTALGGAASSPHSESGAATSTTSATLLTNTFVYLPSYQSVQWTGDITAYSLDSRGNTTTTPVWSAAAALPAPAGRNIFTWDGASTSVPFRTSMSSTLKNLVDPNASTQNNLINYIRGDATNESPVGYRVRTRAAGVSGTLGDFLDSPPTFVKNYVDLGYDNLPSAPGYRAWWTSVKNARPNGVIFEGANDGMLHAFNATNGVELYAYIPNVELPNLVTLSQQDYGVGTNVHRDYVDGPQIETDAYIPTRRAALGWANLIVGTYGAGARGFYALDTTSISGYDAKTLLWERSNKIDGDIGYVFNAPVVGVVPAAPTVTGGLANGSWKAFVGNGVDSDNGKAVLFIVDLATGNIDKKVTLDGGPGNGLMGVTPLLDDKKQVVAVYAGDLKGNVYRVEMTGSNAPVESFNKAPLFRAVGSTGAPQPIVVAPTIFPSPNGGNMVLFGTGRLIDSVDSQDQSQQTFYGVWDKTTTGSSAETAVSPFAANMALGTQRQQLVQQTITPSVSPPGFFAVSSNPVDFVAKIGWFMDLDIISATQRVIYPSALVGEFVLINTVQPALLSKDPCLQTSGSSAYFLLPALDGSAYTAAPVWDVSGNGEVDQSTTGNTDTITTATGTTQAAGYNTTQGAGMTSIVLLPSAVAAAGDTPFDNVGPGGNRIGDAHCLGAKCGPGKITQRVWQQLMTPPF